MVLVSEGFLDDVAVVGMAGKFPGANDVEALWELILNQRDGIGTVPGDRWDVSQPVDAEKRIPSMGGFIDRIAEFDAAFFGISPREAVDMDPQQRLMLEYTFRALEDAGVAFTRLKGRRVGVYVGAFTHDYETLRRRQGVGASQHSIVGTTADIISSRVSYWLGTTGPSMTILTGCSSSAVAIDLAVKALRSGDIESAVVGGVNLILTPDNSIGLTYFGGLSTQGHCAAFAASADGFVRSDGVAAIYLRPLQSALRDRDRVHAVIVDTAVNNDGGGDSLVTPNPDGQRDLLRRAYRSPRISIDDLVYIEAHGTGTRRGDPVEAMAIGEVLAANRAACRGPLLIGSVKSNIGHLEPASGIAGVIKAILCLQHALIPPSLHADELNPDIPFDALRLQVVRQEPVAIPDDGNSLIGVNSFGWGGTNGHVIVRAGTDTGEAESTLRTRLGFLPVSAHSEKSLRKRCRDLATMMGADNAQVDAICAALAVRSPALSRRLAVLGTDSRELSETLIRLADDPATELPAVLAGRPRSVGRTAFVFPGQGSQWLGMGAGLYREDPAFTSAVDACAVALRPYTDWDLISILSSTDCRAWMDRVDQVQPALWAMAVGLSAMWRKAGIEPDVVIGHSQGEIAAATVGGMLTLDDAALVVARRSAVLRAARGSGRMLAVELSEAEVSRALTGFDGIVTLAASNGPSSCVLSGPTEPIEVLKEILEAEGTFCRLVDVDYASHSQKMEQYRRVLEEEFERVQPIGSSIDMLSTVEVRTVDANDIVGRYWVENLRRPVRFADAMTVAFNSGVTQVIEISPHPLLLHAIEQLAHDGKISAVVVPSLHRGKDPTEEMRRSFAMAFVAGLEPFEDLTSPALTTMPQYPLQSSTYWLPTREIPARSSQLVAGIIAMDPSAAQTGLWQGSFTVGTDEMAWVNDHRVGDVVVLPGAVMVMVMVAAAAARRRGEDQGQLTNIEFLDNLLVPSEPVRMNVLLQDGIPNDATIEILSFSERSEQWILHARCLLLPESGTNVSQSPFPDELLYSDAITSEQFYTECANRGLHYGPDFRGVREIHVSPRSGCSTAGSEALARLELSERCGAQSSGDSVHPVMVDCAMQVSLILLGDSDTRVPVKVGAVQLLNKLDGPMLTAWAHAVRQSDGQVDVRIFDDNRRLVLALVGIETRVIDAEVHTEHSHEREFRFTWYAKNHETAGFDSATSRDLHSIVVTGSPRNARRLSTALSERGVCIVGCADVGAAGAAVYVAPASDDGLDAQRRGLVELTELVRGCVESMITPRLVIVTTNAQAVAREDKPDAGAALYWGYGRVAQREHPELRTTLIDISGEAPAREASAVLRDCVAEILEPSGEDQVAMRAGQRYVARIEQGRRTPEPADRETPWSSPAQPFRLCADPHRFWDGVRYRAIDRPTPAAGEVLIEVDAAALNFIDVMKAAGIYPDRAARPDLLGLDCAGLIREIGSGVTDRAVGDRVIACGPGAIASHMCVRAEHTVMVPVGLSTIAAVGISAVTTTAWYALRWLARVDPGETVLIHSGTGGLGLAAIDVARLSGARVIATAGSPSRRQFLRDRGIDDVFDSRGTSWADSVMVVTGGRGVDVVLNSLTGAAVSLGVNVLAEDGRFIEVGKKDIHGERTLSLRAFRKRISFSAVDIAGLMERRPERFARLLNEVWAQVSAGRLQSLPTTTYDFASAAGALRRMSHGDHIGKFVLTMPCSVTDIEPEPMPDGRFRSIGTYIITGGHGGLGISFAEFLIKNGARNIALISRSKPPVTVGARIVEMVNSAAGDAPAEVRSYFADVSHETSLADVLDTIRRSMPPIRGVIHAAGLLDDGTIMNLTEDQIERVLRPKVDGARNLDKLTVDDPLDLFIMFSSAAAMIGSPGQSNYAAANAYMDTFACARRKNGRPALSVQWGPFADVGLAAADENRGSRLAQQGIESLSAEEGWGALRSFLIEDQKVVAYMPLDIRQWFDAFPQCVTQKIWEALRRSTKPGTKLSSTNEFLPELRSADGSEREHMVVQRIKEIAAKVLRMDAGEINAYIPFKSLGVDSLMAIEMRNRLESAFEVRLSITVLWTYGSVAELAPAMLERVTERWAEHTLAQVADPDPE